MTGQNDESTIIELCAVPTFKSAARRSPAIQKAAAVTEGKVLALALQGGAAISDLMVTTEAIV